MRTSLNKLVFRVTFSLASPSYLLKLPMFTRNRFQTDPVRKSDLIGLLFTRDRFGTGPDQIQNWTCFFAGPILDPFPTSSRTVPCKQKPIGSSPVPCKHGLEIQWSQGTPKSFIFTSQTHVSLIGLHYFL